MPYPFHLLENEKIPVPAQDVETFIRHAMDRRHFRVEKHNLDETSRRFQLHFSQREISLDGYLEDNKPFFLHWGGAEILEWSDSTEITRMWATTPEDWFIGKFLLDKDKVMEERFGWLEELSNAVREHFMQPKIETNASQDEVTEKREKLTIANLDFEIVDAEIINILEKLDLAEGLSIGRFVVSPALIRYACPHEFQGLQLQKYAGQVEILETGNLPDEYPPNMSEPTRKYYQKHREAVKKIFSELRKFETVQAPLSDTQSIGAALSGFQDSTNQTYSNFDYPSYFSYTTATVDKLVRDIRSFLRDHPYQLTDEVGKWYDFSIGQLYNGRLGISATEFTGNGKPKETKQVKFVDAIVFKFSDLNTGTIEIDAKCYLFHPDYPGDYPAIIEYFEKLWEMVIELNPDIQSALQVSAAKPEKSESNSQAVKVRSERTEALNRLAVLWVTYNQTQRISKNDGMEWFIEENAKEVGLSYVTVSEFKKHLPKVYEAGIIDKDNKTGRFIPKLVT